MQRFCTGSKTNRTPTKIHTQSHEARSSQKYRYNQLQVHKFNREGEISIRPISSRVNAENYKGETGKIIAKCGNQYSAVTKKRTIRLAGVMRNACNTHRSVFYIQGETCQMKNHNVPRHQSLYGSWKEKQKLIRASENLSALNIAQKYHHSDSAVRPSCATRS